MSDHLPDPEFAAWRGLLRVYRGGVAKNGDSFVDHGRRIPGYIVDALDDLIRTGDVVLGQPDSVGYEWASLTQTGQTRLTALNERLETGDRRAGTGPAYHPATRHRWAISQVDHHSHVIDDGVVVTRCGQYLPSNVPSDPTTCEPACPRCTAIVVGGKLIPPPNSALPEARPIAG